MQRSAISVISRSTDTGRFTRTRSPRASIAPRKARRLSSAMVDGADATREQLVLDVSESGRREAVDQGRRRWEPEHRLWQGGIGLPMFRPRAADGGEHALQIEEVEGAQRRPRGGRKLEDDEAGARAPPPMGPPLPRVPPPRRPAPRPAPRA